MAKRFTHSYYGQKVGDTTLFLLEIYDEEFSEAGTVLPLDLQYPGVRVSQQGSGSNDIFDPIKPTTLSWMMKESSDSHEDFVNDLITSGEGRFWCKFYMNGTLLYRAKLLADGVTIPDQHRVNTYVGMEAVCGLVGLRNVDFTDSEAISQPTRWHLFVNDVLSKMEMEDYFTAEEEYLCINDEWYPHSLATTVSPWEHTFSPPKAFTTKDNVGRYDPMSAWQVLYNLLKVKGCQIRMINGRYEIIQVSGQTASTYRYRAFNKAAAPIDWVEDVDITKQLDKLETNFVLNGRQWRFLPALKRYEIDYRHGGVTSSNFLADIVVNDALGPLDFQQVDDENGEAKLKLSGKLVITWAVQQFTTNTDWPVETSFRIVYAVKIKVGDYWYSRPYTLNGIQSVTYGSEAWSNTEAYYYIVSPVISVRLEPNTPYERTQEVLVDFTTLALPGDGILSFDFDHDAYIDYAGNFADAFDVEDYVTARFVLDGANLEIIGSDLNAGKEYTRTYLAESNVTYANSEIVTDEVVIGDGPFGGSDSAILYDPTGGAFLLTSDWRTTPAEAPRRLLDIVVQTMMGFRAKPLRLVQGGIHSSEMLPHHRIDCDPDGLIYYPITVEWSTAENMLTGEWFVIAYDPTPIVPKVPKTKINTPEDILVDIKTGSDNTSPDDQQPVGPKKTTHDKINDVLTIFGIDQTDDGIEGGTPIDRIPLIDGTTPIPQGTKIVIVDAVTTQYIELVTSAPYVPGVSTELEFEEVTPDFDIPAGSIVTIPAKGLITNDKVEVINTPGKVVTTNITLPTSAIYGDEFVRYNVQVISDSGQYLVPFLHFTVTNANTITFFETPIWNKIMIKAKTLIQ